MRILSQCEMQKNETKFKTWATPSEQSVMLMQSSTTGKSEQVSVSWRDDDFKTKLLWSCI